MFRDLLVPIDGSAFAETALPLASRLARLAKARLHLLLAHEPELAMIGMGDMLPPPPQLDEERRNRERMYLNRITSSLRQATALPVGCHEAIGAAGPAICEEASRVDADLIVMATHGRGAFKRMWLGSVADYAVRHLAVPVLLVRPGAPEASAPLESIRGIIAALDLSGDAEAILEPAVALAQLTGAHLMLLHVVESIFEIETPAPSLLLQDSGLVEAARAEAQKQLDRVAGGLRERGLSVSAKVITGINAAGGLLDTLNQDGYDLMALTTHGRGGLRRLLLGSVADKVIRGAGKPVLVMRPLGAV